MAEQSLSIDTIVSPPFMENSLVVRADSRTDCLVVDPGFDPEKLIERIIELKLEPAMILLTHGHADHIAGNHALKDRFPDAPLVIGEGDAHMLTDPVANLSFLGGENITSPAADKIVREGDTIEAAGIELSVLEIPGHSAGHVVYVISATSPQIVLGGDVLFQGSVGRVDFPGGSGPQLIQGIREKLFPLPDDTIVYPGHGPTTTIGIEKESNPFCGRNAGLVDLQ